MPEPPSGGQTGVLQRQTGVSRRHTWTAPTVLVSYNRNVATLLLLILVAGAETLIPQGTAALAPWKCPGSNTLPGVNNLPGVGCCFESPVWLEAAREI